MQEEKLIKIKFILRCNRNSQVSDRALQTDIRINSVCVEEASVLVSAVKTVKYLVALDYFTAFAPLSPPFDWLVEELPAFPFRSPALWARAANPEELMSFPP